MSAVVNSARFTSFVGVFRDGVGRSDGGSLTELEGSGGGTAWRSVSVLVICIMFRCRSYTFDGSLGNVRRR